MEDKDCFLLKQFSEQDHPFDFLVKSTIKLTSR